MQYLIIPRNLTSLEEPFFTDWYEYPEKYLKDSTVIDLRAFKYSTNGVDWLPINFDHL